MCYACMSPSPSPPDPENEHLQVIGGLYSMPQRPHMYILILLFIFLLGLFLFALFLLLPGLLLTTYYSLDRF